MDGFSALAASSPAQAVAPNSKIDTSRTKDFLMWILQLGYVD
jgi:hypothetical protein